MQPPPEFIILKQITRRRASLDRNHRRIVERMQKIEALKLRSLSASENEHPRLAFQIGELRRQIARTEAYDKKVRTELQHLGRQLATVRTQPFEFYEAVKSSP